MSSNWIGELEEELAVAASKRDLLARFCSVLRRNIHIDFAELIFGFEDDQVKFNFSDNAKLKNPSIFALTKAGFNFRGNLIRLPLFFGDARPHFRSPDLVSALHGKGIRSLTALPILFKDRLSGVLEIGFTSQKQWGDGEINLLQEAVRVLSTKWFSFVAQRRVQQSGSDRLKQAELHINRIVELGDVIILRTDANLNITEIVGNTVKLFGLDVRTILNVPGAWRKSVDERELRDLKLLLGSTSLDEELSFELRVVNQKTGESRWLLLKGVPVLSSEGRFTGYEGFAFDITEKHLTQNELVSERKRIEALYAVSRAIQAQSDPALVSLKGIKALKGATNSDSAIACFFDTHRDTIEIVAAEGFSEESLEEIAKLINGRSLIRQVIENKTGIIVDDVEQDRKIAAVDALKKGNIKSALALPLMHNGNTIGGVALFSKKRSRFTEADSELVQAAIAQIALVIKQAEFYAAEIKQANAVATLYQLSHELSRLMTPREMAAHAFPIIQGEIACKRIWLGIMNDQGTQILGQAGVGPDVRRNVIDMHIDLQEQSEFLKLLLSSREPIIVSKNQQIDCASLARLRTKLDLNTVVVVPLVSIGQVVGLMILEPTISSTTVVQRKLPLVKSMAGEMAAVMIARRFESKMAEADKMRMAGLLASGVAHNFNNLLQAIMGQASLIELQLPQDSNLVTSAKMILDSANKGGSLIKQLMSFSTQGGSVRRTIVINELLQESYDLYRSLLGSRISLNFNLGQNIPPVYADSSMLQQVVTNLFMNAKEAIGNKKDGQVAVTTSEVRIRSGEVGPELAPGIYLRLDISDNGIGMDAEKKARCFEPFYTTKNLDVRTGVGLSGAGLGLSSAYSIVKQHEGLIAIQSRVGEGSTFSIYLPALTVKVEDTDRSAIEKIVLKPGIHGTVVAVGLAAEQLVETRKNLAQAGIDLVSVPGLAEGRDKMRALSSDCVLVLANLDAIMPTPLNIELIEFINDYKRQRTEAKMVLLATATKKWREKLNERKEFDIFEPAALGANLNRLIRLVLREPETSKISKSEGTNG